VPRGRCGRVTKSGRPRARDETRTKDDPGRKGEDKGPQFIIAGWGFFRAVGTPVRAMMKCYNRQTTPAVDGRVA